MDFATLFRYDVESDQRIGAGGCGELWKGHDRLLDESIALKTIRDELATNPRAVRSFELEAIASARLSRENAYVVPVRDFGRIEDWYYLVMDWIPPSIDGRPDISKLAGRCSLARARQILLHVSKAADHAHRRGIVHSDIAPWNIMYREKDDRYLLADFGLLKVAYGDLLSVPSRSVLAGGRRAFLPPYAREDFSEVSAATDTYALAVTFWQLLSGDEVLKHGDEIPGVIRVNSMQRDAPSQVRQLLVRFVESHDPGDSVPDFLEMLQRVPAT